MKGRKVKQEMISNDSLKLVERKHHGDNLNLDPSSSVPEHVHSPCLRHRNFPSAYFFFSFFPPRPPLINMAPVFT